MRLMLTFPSRGCRPNDKHEIAPPDKELNTRYYEDPLPFLSWKTVNSRKTSRLMREQTVKAFE